MIRDLEYAFELDIPGNWEELDSNRFRRPDGEAHITVVSARLDDETLEEYANTVRKNLARDWWDDASMLEVYEFERVRADGREYYRMRYRVQESPEYCVLDVIEVVGVADDIPGRRVGFRTRGDACEWRQLTSLRRIVQSFEVVVRPPSYYTQFIDVAGVVIKASDDVVPEALYRAAETVDAMMQGRLDIVECMADKHAAVAIVAETEWVTDLPEFRWLSGREDFTGRPYDGFAIRGLGAVAGQPISATAEENLLHKSEAHEFIDVTIHEFAHAIENLCLTSSDRRRLNALYETILGTGRIKGTHASADVDEFFAVFSTVYFNATRELYWLVEDQDELADVYPDVYSFLWEIYGTVSTDSFRR